MLYLKGLSRCQILSTQGCLAITAKMGRKTSRVKTMIRGIGGRPLREVDQERGRQESGMDWLMPGVMMTSSMVGLGQNIYNDMTIVMISNETLRRRSTTFQRGYVVTQRCRRQRSNLVPLSYPHSRTTQLPTFNSHFVILCRKPSHPLTLMLFVRSASDDRTTFPFVLKVAPAPLYPSILPQPQL